MLHLFHKILPIQFQSLKRCLPNFKMLNIPEVIPIKMLFVQDKIKENFQP